MRRCARDALHAYKCRRAGAVRHSLRTWGVDVLLAFLLKSLAIMGVVFRVWSAPAFAELSCLGKAAGAQISILAYMRVQVRHEADYRYVSMLLSFTGRHGMLLGRHNKKIKAVTQRKVRPCRASLLHTVGNTCRFL
jgi:hypothetical protein